VSEKSVSIKHFLVIQHIIWTAKHEESKIRKQKFKQQCFALLLLQIIIHLIAVFAVLLYIRIFLAPS
jgi:hypothetical protein